MTGKLVLVGTPIGNAGDLSPRAVAALESADVVACEDTRHTRKLLAVAGITTGPLVAVHQHNEAEAADAIVRRMVVERATVALVTDAGMPGVSDPGERVVRAALDAGIPVEAVPGPTAATTAIALSGLPSARWCFEGFLPRKGKERAARLDAIRDEPRTVVLYEAPHRLRATLADLAEALGPARRIAVARELTKLFEEVWRGTLPEAVAHSDDVEPRGEYTLVVEGAPPREPPDEPEIAAAVEANLLQGMSRKDAAAAAAEELGVPRRVAYELANRARRASDR